MGAASDFAMCFRDLDAAWSSAADKMWNRHVRTED